MKQMKILAKFPVPLKKPALHILHDLLKPPKSDMITLSVITLSIPDVTYLDKASTGNVDLLEKISCDQTPDHQVGSSSLSASP